MDTSTASITTKFPQIWETKFAEVWTTPLESDSFKFLGEEPNLYTEADGQELGE